MELSITKTKTQNETFLRNFQINQSGATFHPEGKSQTRIQNLAKKNKKEDWENFAYSLNSITPIHQALSSVRQLKGEGPKK